MTVPTPPKTRGPTRRRVPKPMSPACQQVLIALRRIIRATDLHSKQLSKESGLTITQALLLQSIHELGEVTTRQLSRHVNLSQGTVTTVLDRLERRGLIERYRSAVDRRIVHERLTRQGAAVLRRMPPLLHERFTDAFSSLTARQQQRIVGTLERVAAMMGAEDLDAAPLLDVRSPVDVNPTAQGVG